jgi:hypothetical protein
MVYKNKKIKINQKFPEMLGKKLLAEVTLRNDSGVYEGEKISFFDWLSFEGKEGDDHDDQIIMEMW